MADTKKDTKTGFTDAERDAMKQRAEELRAEKAAGKGAKAREKGIQDCREAIDKLTGSDKAIATKFHEIVTEYAPELDPKTWYGMPAYAKDGKVVTFFSPAQKFDTRYASIGFEAAAALDDGDMWPVGFAVLKIGAAEEQKLIAMVQKAVS